MTRNDEQLREILKTLFEATAALITYLMIDPSEQCEEEVED